MILCANTLDQLVCIGKNVLCVCFQEELDRLLALQFEQSGFGDDDIPPGISETPSDAPGNTEQLELTGHSALDIANNS